MYKLLAALSTVELAHQKALTTRNTWLGERAHVPEPRNASSERVITPPRSQLLDDLAELAEGTTIMGKPEKTPPRFGLIASPETRPAKVSKSQQLHDNPSPAPGARRNYTEIVAPVPVVPIPLLHRTFEVRISTTILSEPLSAFCESFDENRPESPESCCDENAPPSRLFGQELVSTDIEIPKPQLRGCREPFAVLHFDLGGAPSEDGDEQNHIVDADDLEDAGGNCKVVGVFYEGVNIASGYRLKGWDRLHSKAPQAIDINPPQHKELLGIQGFSGPDYNEIYVTSNPLRQPGEKSDAPPAPKMTSVPLPPEIFLSRASLSLSNDLEDVATLVSQKKFSPQMTPCRQNLLTILNGGPKP